MKNFVFIITVFCFTFGSVLSAMAASPCMHQNKNNMAMAKTMDGDMPCHENNVQHDQKQKTQKHCDGICLCAYTASTQGFMHSTFVTLYIHKMDLKTQFTTDRDLASLHPAPPLRPPKLNS